MARGRGGLIGALCFSLGSRLAGKTGGGAIEGEGICGFTLTPCPLPSRERGLIGVFSHAIWDRVVGDI